MKKIMYPLLLLLTLVWNNTSMAQTTSLHHIEGFRSAHFGMSEEQVRAAIKNDFNIADDAIVTGENKDQATKVLKITLPQLSPGPGAASVYYIFGATSAKLMHVNVAWTTADKATKEQRDAIGVAGMQLARYFSDLHWKPNGTVTGFINQPTEVLLFAGIDPKDAGVEVIVSGIPTTDVDGKTTTPKGAATLSIRYMAHFAKPDVVTVEAGKF